MTLSAGSCEKSILPNKPLRLHGYPHVDRVSTGVHDPLLASALYLENDSRAIVLIALDLLLLDIPTARALRQAVAGAIDVPEDAVFISCTHTHSSPGTSEILAWKNDPSIRPPDPEYLEHIMQQTIAAAQAAKSAQKPASLRWTSAFVDGVGSNRLDPDGPIDREAELLVVADPAGEEIRAVAMIYGMHPTVMHEDSSLISSDFLHYTRLQIKEKFGSELVVCCHNAPCGNLSPRYSVKAQTFAEAERLGRKLGSSVAEALDKLTAGDFSTTAVLAGKLDSVEPPRRELASLPEAQKVLQEYRRNYQQLKEQGAPHGPVRTAECAIFGAEGQVNLAELQSSGELDAIVQKYKPIQLQGVRIQDKVIAGVPGEFFVEYALEFKQKTNRKAFLVSLVNGHMQGYVVTPEAAAAGGYEATGAIFAPETGALMLTAATQMSEELLAL